MMASGSFFDSQGLNLSCITTELEDILFVSPNFSMVCKELNVLRKSIAKSIK